MEYSPKLFGKVPKFTKKKRGKPVSVSSEIHCDGLHHYVTNVPDRKKDVGLMKVVMEEEELCARSVTRDCISCFVPYHS